MYCLKCGRESIADQVFCDSCLEEMARYPVKPDAAVNLPHRPQAAVPKKQPSRKRTQSPEEQIARLRKQVRRLTAALALATLVLALATAMLLHIHLDDNSTPAIGRNYTIDTTLQP